jgi:hypothetical protein
MAKQARENAVNKDFTIFYPSLLVLSELNSVSENGSLLMPPYRKQQANSLEWHSGAYY